MMFNKDFLDITHSLYFEKMHGFLSGRESLLDVALEQKSTDKSDNAVGCHEKQKTLWWRCIESQHVSKGTP